jgi:hypothetical protein
MCLWLLRKDSNFYKAGIQVLVQRWKKTVDKDGSYIENTYAFSYTGSEVP